MIADLFRFDWETYLLFMNVNQQFVFIRHLCVFPHSVPIFMITHKVDKHANLFKGVSLLLIPWPYWASLKTIT